MKRQEITRPDGATVVFDVVDTPHREAALPPLLFLPGWLCTAESWLPTAKRLGRIRRCVTIDFPGFGRSDPGNRTDWSLAAFGADVAAVIAELGDQPAIVIGHSMGGAVALETAIAAPGRCCQIVAVDSLIHPEFYDHTDEARIESVVRTFENLPAAIPVAMAAYTLPGRNAPNVDTAIAQMAGADPVRGLAVLRAFLRWDIDRRLPDVDVPVAVIAAAPFMSEKVASRWSARIELRTIDDVGHFVMLDNPRAFDNTLSAIIAREPI